MSDLSLKKDNTSYLKQYRWICTKRFLVQTIMIMAFQYSIILSLPFSRSFISLPLYPSMGIAFSLFYLLGNRSIWGLLIGGFGAYFLKNMPMTYVLFYLLADIGGGYLGARLCQTVLSSDIKPFGNPLEYRYFIKINTIVCLFSSSLRVFPFVFNKDTLVDFNNLNFFLMFLNAWIADLNSILVMAGFLLSWAYISFSREKIAEGPIKKPILFGFLIYVFILTIFLKHIDSIYGLGLGMLITLIGAYYYGYLVATALLFILSSLDLAYFIIHGSSFTATFLLFLFIISLFWAGHTSFRLFRFSTVK